MARFAVRSFRNQFSSSNGPKNSSTTRGPITFVGLGLMVALGGGLMFYYNLEKENKTQKVASDVTSVGKAALGGVPWVLVDEDGHLRTDSDFKGKWSLLYFGFTYCPDICPSELVKIGKVVKGLEEEHKAELLPIFISVDPNRDTVGQIRCSLSPIPSSSPSSSPSSLSSSPLGTTSKILSRTSSI